MTEPCLSSIDVIIGNVGQDTLANIEDQIVSSVKKYLFAKEHEASHQALVLSILSHLFSSNLPPIDILILSLLLTSSTDSQTRMESIIFLTKGAKVLWIDTLTICRYFISL